MPISLGSCCTHVVGQLDSRPDDCLVTILSIPLMVASCRSLKTSRCVAWYLELRGYPTTCVLYVGLGFLFARALASFRTSLVMCVKCSLKSTTVLMSIPISLYDLSCVRHSMQVPSRKVIMWICSCSVVWILCERGFPRAHRAPMALQFVVYNRSPVYWLKRCSFLS